MIESTRKFVNTEYFREEARFFQKHGYYTDAPPGTEEHYAYWSEQLRRCQDGYSVGGMKITGDHYGYMNFGQIRLTQDPNRNEKITKVRSAKKVITFPDFWDGDYEYFWAVNIAFKGMDQAAYDALGLDIKILKLDGGHHICLAKARRKGYSYKNGFMAANRYNAFKNYTTLLGAFEKKYLYPDGTMTMATNYLNFFNEHTAWTKRRGVSDKVDHRKASFVEYLNGLPIEKGYKSQIMAITFQNNPDAARGKDGDLIFFEEAGAFDNLKASYMATKPAVEDGAITTGQMIVFGTGGDMDNGTVDFESMFYDPEPYNMLPIENIWDEGSAGTSCGFFFPVYKNMVGFMDDDGNSLIEEAKEHEYAIRDNIKKTSVDPNVISNHSTEYPFTPREAFIQTNANLFPVVDLSKHRNELVVHKLTKHLATHGNLVRESGGLKFRPSDKAIPVIKFPSAPGDNLTGCVTMYQPPFRDSKQHVPNNLYIIVHDPYALDTDGGESLGSAYVIKRVNRFSSPSDMIVASYIGRPGFQDEYNDNLFKLAEYYNAKIGFENDRGAVTQYAKRFKLLSWLMHEVEIIDKSENINIQKLGRIYGTSMGSKQRKAQAQIYLRDWLMTKRGNDENGNPVYNFHYIYDVGLLDELIRYHPKGNFDRVSAMLIGMFYMIDMQNKPPEDITKEAPKDDDSFFGRVCFD